MPILFKSTLYNGIFVQLFLKPPKNSWNGENEVKKGKESYMHWFQLKINRPQIPFTK